MDSSAQQNVTRILGNVSSGHAHAAEELLPLIYEELRSLASRQMAAETPGQTLQPTALVHEAYLRLVGSVEHGWDSRGHFYAAAARAMRQILVNRAHKRRAVKHGGGRVRLDLSEIEQLADEPPPERMLALDEAIGQLEKADSRKARIVMLRYFAGLSVEETAKALAVSSPTVKRDWRFAKAWLQREMTRDEVK